MLLWTDNEIPHHSGAADFEPYLEMHAVEGARLGVVICPGGAYFGRSAHEGTDYARWLNTIGVSAAVLEYRVYPSRAPAQIADAQRAIRLARAVLSQSGAEKIGVMGSSAGGHLTATASVHFGKDFYPPLDTIDRLSARPDFSILCYPVIDMGVPSFTRKNLLGDTPSEEAQVFYSPHLHVTKDAPPTFLWHTAADEGVSAANSMLYAEALVRYGIPCELHIYPEGPHGMGLAQDDPYVGQWTRALERWLKTHV